MTLERWARIKEVFNAALERDEKERPGFIAAACGSDEELRRELERLLREYSHTPFLESPLKPHDLTGRTVTHYRILEKLRTGVWERSNAPRTRTFSATSPLRSCRHSWYTDQLSDPP